MTRRATAGLFLFRLGMLGLLAYVGFRAWQGPGDFFAHPARAIAVGWWGIVILAILASKTSGASPGVREDRRNRWIFLPLLPLMATLVWLAPYGEPRGFGTFGGDGVRYLGLALFVGGTVLRLSAIYALGRRFSGLVAIQRDHELATAGPYQRIRHPAYLGLLLLLAGWALLFRSGPGLVLVALIGLVFVVRMNAEEALLRSHFGGAYADYCGRTWRLVPYLY